MTRYSPPAAILYSPLAAILSGDGELDEFLAALVPDLVESGLNVRGVLQGRGAESGGRNCQDMDLTTVQSDRTFRISQSLGIGSRGCRLNPGALAECSAFIEGELRAGAALLVLNRFGRAESEGRGFRDLMGMAITLGVPVLTAVRPAYAAGWAAFGANAACDLPMERAAILDWAAKAQGARSDC